MSSGLMAGRTATAIGVMLGSLVFAGAASAATLTQMSGGVFVDAGQGYKPASLNMGLAPGNIVMVNVGGNAQITFDGCSIPVEFGNIYVVPEGNPCTAANNTPGFDTGTILVGVAVAGGIGAAIALSGGDSGGGGGSGGGGTGGVTGGGGGPPP